MAAVDAEDVAGNGQTFVLEKLIRTAFFICSTF
jgi:hypothetical protein